MHLSTFHVDYDGTKLTCKLVPSVEAVASLGWPAVRPSWTSDYCSDGPAELMNELGCELTRAVAWCFRESDRINAKNRVNGHKNRREDATNNAVDAMLAEVENLRIITDPLF